MTDVPDAKMTPNAELNVIYLGFAERAAYVRDGDTNLFKWNVLGLKSIILSNIYPFSLSGWSIGIALRSSDPLGEHKFRIVDISGKEAGFINIVTKPDSPDHPEAVLRGNGPVMMIVPEGWTIAFLHIANPGIVIQAPGTYNIWHVESQGETIVGQLHFAVVDPPPLTSERIASIRTDPSAMKAVRMELGCNECSAKHRIYAALERNVKSEGEGWIWYRDLKDNFQCECGKTSIALESIRKNLYGLLGSRHRGNEEINLVPLYELNSLETVRSTFASLIEAKPREEILQRFLEENPILLHQFPSTRLFSKPPILSFFVADFALLTSKKELLLIEIEKTSTRLMKKNGGVAAELSHAFDQVRDWLHVVDEHRLAVLDALRIGRDEVSAIRGVVIAGRDVGYDAHHLRKLKGEDWGRISLYTYDDLLFALHALIRRVDSL